jgi:23S rRNA pseudouridine2605 synthase
VTADGRFAVRHSLFAVRYSPRPPDSPYHRVVSFDLPPTPVRLQKLLSSAGIASRRTAEALILEGRVTVNGEVVRTLGAKADPAHDDIRVDDRRVKAREHPRYVLLNKPAGYVTTRKDPQGRRTVLDLLTKVRDYVYPVGRLDYDTEGLLLLTNDGDLAAALTHPRHEVARVYEAIVAGAPDARAVEKLRRGVVLDGHRTAPAYVEFDGSVTRKGRETSRLLITLHEGRNRQVRNMCAAVGHPVQKLRRVKMGPLALGDLPVGAWRELTPAEVAALQRATTRGGTAKKAAAPTPSQPSSQPAPARGTGKPPSRGGPTRRGGSRSTSARPARAGARPPRTPGPARRR